MLGLLDKKLGIPYNKIEEDFMSNLSASLEDYLELICNLLETSESVKAVELSRKLNVSRASVSEALAKLAEKELILYEGHKGITITEKGLKKAKEVISKHNTLTSFFENTLCMSIEQASNNACKIEHVISDELFERIKLFQAYISSHQDIINDFKKGIK